MNNILLKLAKINKTTKILTRDDIRQHNIRTIKLILEKNKGIQIFRRITRPIRNHFKLRNEQGNIYIKE